MARVLVSASSQYLGASSSPISSNSSPFTFAGRFKLTSTSGLKAIGSIGDSGSSTNRCLVYTENAGTAIYLFSQTGSGTFGQATKTTTVSAGTWYSFAAIERRLSRDIYLNGSAGTVDNTNLTISSLSGIYAGASRTGGGFNLYSDSTIADYGLWNVELTADELASLSAGVSPLLIRPSALVGYWPMLGRATDEEDWVGARTLTNVNSATVGESPRIIVPASYLLEQPAPAGGGATNLIVPDSSHTHTLDNVVLTSSTLLVVQDMAHAHALDAPTLSTDTALTVSDAQHVHALDNVTLSTTGATSLTVADSLHGHVLDAVVLTSQTDLAAADMAHAHALDGVTLTLGGINLVIAEIMHAHALDAVALTLDTYLVVADLLHAHAIDNVLVSTPGGTLDLILKILANRQELNPATGTFTLYDNDGTTVLYTTNAWADAAGTVPYSGGALRRIDALF